MGDIFARKEDEFEIMAEGGLAWKWPIFDSNVRYAKPRVMRLTDDKRRSIRSKSSVWTGTLRHP